MKMSFSIECIDTYGLATFYAHIGIPKPNLQILDGAKYLQSCERVLCCFDTGANQTAISKSISDKLQLPTKESNIHIQSINSHTASEEKWAGICLPNNFVIASIPVTVVDLGLNPIELNIGMDIISLGQLALFRKDGKLTLSFSVDS